ncbi:MAG TPA: mycothiol system anti-sigma-R factor [Candidatus Limnocylindria bacterium]|nr:mycothiol system anti-sigma-R factor [Candidatus Limnocylindria bacterium]
MDCNDCLEKLYSYLDRELSPVELTAVRTHLDDCGGCEDQFVVEDRFLARVRDCCHEDVAPSDLRTRIVARLRMEHDAPR